MAILTLSNAYLSFSDHPLLDYANMAIEAGERVCLVGRNGAGKSTLLKILAGEAGMDDGQLIIEKDRIIARLEQDPPRHIEGTVFDYVAEGVRELADLLKEYHQLSLKIAQDYQEKTMNRLSEVQSQLDHLDGWRFETRIQDC